MPVVAVLMPCRNAAPWVAAAVRSCLEQDVDCEIIAVDDGSTDATREILGQFGPTVTVVDGPAKGAPTARNIAFEASSAPYVQYLDADDVILPGKFEAQLGYLEANPADAVYGDWRYWFDDGETRHLGPVQRAGPQEDPVEALLDDWWIPSMAPLYRREAVAASGGWDPSARAGQDHDFLLSVVIAGAVLAYQPGCHSLYRRHSEGTVSRKADPTEWLAARVAMLEKAESALVRQGSLTPRRRESLGRSYARLAGWWWDHDRDRARSLYARAVEMGTGVDPGASAGYRRVLAVAGFERAEQLASIRRRALRRLGRSFEDPHPTPGR